MKPRGKPVKWSPEIAYVAGLITTDGSLSIDGRHLNITSNDIQLLNVFKKCLGINNKISAKLSGYTGKKSSHYIQFGNVILYKWLLNIGLMPNKTKRIRALKIPNKYYLDFLRGHLDGDGCIQKYQDPVYPNSQRLYIRFHSASLEHLKWIQQKLKHLLGVKGYFQKFKGELGLTFAKRESLKLLHRIYPTPDVPCLKRKYKIVKSILENKKPR